MRVSWFAARAFASVAGQASADERPNGRGRPRRVHQPRWARPNRASAGRRWRGSRGRRRIPLPAAGCRPANLYGARDLSRLVWEWVDDFNTAMVTGESRADTGLERNLFCGAGAAGARDLRKLSGVHARRACAAPFARTTSCRTSDSAAPATYEHQDHRLPFARRSLRCSSASAGVSRARLSAVPLAATAPAPACCAATVKPATGRVLCGDRIRGAVECAFALSTRRGVDQ